MIISLILVLLILIFGYFGFGLFLLKKTKLKLALEEELVIGSILSISLVTSLVALLGQFVSTKAYLLLIPVFILGATEYKKIFNIFKTLGSLIKKNIVGTIFFVLSILVLSSTLIFSHFNSHGNLVLQEIHDSVWHVALIENLQESIPPLHPSSDSVVLNNYHYFYDLFLSGIVKYSNISEFVLYFQVSVILLSTLLVGSAFVVGKKLRDTFAGYLLVGSTVFIGSISYIIPLLFHPEQPWGESSFWVSQTLVMIVNPQVIYTLAVTYIFILLVSKLELIKKLNKENLPKYFWLHTIIIVLTATSIGFKSYAWVILSFVYAFVLLRELIKYKSIYPILVGLVYSLISVPFVWLITRFAGSSFFYAPLWFTDSMIESPDRVNYLEWKFLKDHYLFKKNWPRLWILEAKKIALFYFGNLGIRSLFIGLPVFYILKKFRKNINWVLVNYIFVGILFSSIFPLLFLQRGTVWNSIQFWYYTLIFANILFVLFLSKLLKNKSKILVAFVLAVLFIAAIPTGVKTIQDKTRKPFELDSRFVSVLNEIDSSENILICPEGYPAYHSALIKVLTPASVYLANPSQLELVGSDDDIIQEYEEIFKQRNSIEFKKLIEKEDITKIICNDKHQVNIINEMLISTEENKELDDKQIEGWHIINL